MGGIILFCPLNDRGAKRRGEPSRPPGRRDLSIMKAGMKWKPKGLSGDTCEAGGLLLIPFAANESGNLHLG